MTQDTERTEEVTRTRLETEALVLGYAMSRLDAAYLSGRGLRGWQEAYREAAAALSEPPASFNNLRDEFDPVHPNPRKGWRNRPLRPTRLRVIDELQDVSDDALLELVSRILNRDEEAVAEAVDALAVVTRIPHNVAERLLTGRRAEEFFMENAKRLTQIEPADMVDCRQQACGFDFGVRGEPRLAFEVKGLKPLRGGIQFTDREWREAKSRRGDYRLVVVVIWPQSRLHGYFQTPTHVWKPPALGRLRWPPSGIPLSLWLTKTANSSCRACSRQCR